MKTLIKLVSAIVFTMALANCGGGGGGGGGQAAVQDNGITADSAKIDYTDGSNLVSWSNSAQDFYVTYSNGQRKCFKRSADDQNYSEVYAQLVAYLSSSVVGKGSRDSIGSNPRYLVITYTSGTVRTFNLNTESATVEQETLSNASEIIAFLDDLHSDIDNQSGGNCFVGK